MPRKPVPRDSINPIHITARSLNRERWEVSQEAAWEIFEDFLYLVNVGYGLKILAFVMMPNHFHLLVIAPRGNLSEAMCYFMRETSREFSRISGRINQSYGSRHHPSLISTYHYFMNAYKYVYRNPVRGNLCELVEEYPYSTLPQLLGLRRGLIPVEEDTILFRPNFDAQSLKWLNLAPQRGHEEEMRIALKRTIFELRPSRTTGKQSSLIEDLL